MFAVERRYAVTPKVLQIATHVPGPVGRRAKVILRWRTYCGCCPYIARSRHAAVRRAMVRHHRSIGCWTTIEDRLVDEESW